MDGLTTFARSWGNETALTYDKLVIVKRAKASQNHSPEAVSLHGRS
jgi:hypothetical protein